jgi:ferredoxin-NADP reductase
VSGLSIRPTALAGSRPQARRRLVRAATWLTTPLLPDDYLALVNPMWSTRGHRGRIVAVRPETARSATVVIRPGRDWPEHRAGQYVGVGVEIDGVRHRRSYSLTSVPGAPDGCIAITVKAVDDGLVSAHLVRRAAPGAVVHLELPAGAFVVPDPCPETLLFVTAGSGITPVMGILRTIAGGAASPDVVVVHADRSEADVMFGPELRALARDHGWRLHEHHSSRDGRLTAAGLAGLVDDWSARPTWACGPAGMLDALEEHYATAGLEHLLHVERFRPRPRAPLDAAGGPVTFTRSGRTVEAGPGTTLLDAGEGAGALMPSGCRMGICHTCVGRLQDGQVRDVRTGELHGAPGELVQTCVSVAAGPVEIDL